MNRNGLLAFAVATLTPKRIYQSPIRIFIMLTLSVFLAETGVMIIISMLPPLSMWVETFLDSFLLIILISPVLYFVLFRPLIPHVIDRKKGEEKGK